MRRQILAIGIIILLSISPASARVRGAAAQGATGSAVLNIGGGDKIPANIINVLKSATLSFATPSDVSKLDADNYLTSTPAGNVTLSFPAANTMFTGTQYKLSWGSGLRFGVLNVGSIITSCTSAVNVTVSGCSGSSTTFTPTGTSGGSVVFTTSANQFNMFFGTTGTYSRTSGELALYRLSDETDFLAGEIWTPEFKAVIRGLNPRAIRPMGMVQQAGANFNGETTWNYRNKPTAITWGVNFAPGAVGGTISGTDTYTGSAAPDTPVSWTDGEQYIGVVTNANTSASVTIDIGGRGAKSVVNIFAGALSAGNIAANSIGTFTYDAIIDKVLYRGGGISGSVPIEAQAQLANRVNSNLWAVIPPWASDNYVTQWAAAVRDNLDPALFLYPEYSNEIWNGGFPQTGWAGARGTAFGWVGASNQNVYGWYGLRVRQIMGTLLPSVLSPSRMRRVMAYQAGGDITNISNRFNGSQLTPGNAAYNAYTGSANYSAFPNRPIDVVEVLAYAPYGGGTNLCTGPDLNCTPGAANAPFYQALVTAWELPDPTTAIALVDDDIRTGRTLVQNVTASGTTFTTPVAHGFTANSTSISFQVTGGTTYSGIAVNTIYRVTTTPTSTTFTMQPYVGGFPSGSDVNAGSAGTGTTTVGSSQNKNLVNLASTWYQFGESNAALYDSARSGAGMAALRVEQYEGNMEPQGPTAGQCTSLGITGADCTGSIAAAITAWKQDTKARATQLAYFNQFAGLDPAAPATYGLMPHSKSPSQLILPQGGSACTGSAYALLSGCLPTSTPFQLYYGFADFRNP